MALEMLPIPRKSKGTVKSMVQDKVQLIQCEKKRMNPQEGVITWVQPHNCNGVDNKTNFWVDASFRDLYSYECKKEKRKAIEIEDLTVDVASPIRKKKRKWDDIYVSNIIEYNLDLKNRSIFIQCYQDSSVKSHHANDTVKCVYLHEYELWWKGDAFSTFYYDAHIVHIDCWIM